MQTRRGTEVVAILAILASPLFACSTIDPGIDGLAAAGTPDEACHAPPETGRPQLVIGYGSLMQDESRMRTAPQAGAAHPVEVQGFRRGWFARGQSVGLSTTYLGVVAQATGRINAVIYSVDPAGLLATDRREVSYCRVAVPAAGITSLEGGYSPPPDAQAWIYVNRREGVAVPDSQHPIVQSYVDIFLSGCLEQEQRFGLDGFGRECVSTTSDWSVHWVNDRVYPRRPFIFQPRAMQIDSLLSKEVNRYFSRIRIESGG